MKHWLQKTFLLGCVVALPLMDASAQFFPKNDTTSTFVSTTNSFGRIQSYDGSGGKYDAGTDKMIDRLYQIIGFSESYVWNPNDDPDVNPVDTVYYVGSDSSRYVREVVMDNSFRETPPFPIQVSTVVQLFENGEFGLAEFGVTNTSETNKVFKLSVLLRAKLLNVYGGETLEYDESTGRLYIYTNDGAIGIQAIDAEAIGVNLLDFNDYDSTAPERDNARQLQRWEAMSTEEIPSESVQTGADGGWAFLNFGDSPTLPKGGYVSITVAYTHGADLDEVDARLDAALEKYSEVQNDAVAEFNDDYSPFVATANSFGRIQTYDGSEGKFDSSTDKMIDRLYQLVGESDSYVWNPNDDPDINLLDTVFVDNNGARYVRELVMDNSFREDPPFPINVSTSVVRLKGHNYGLAQFGVTNTSESEKVFKLSVLLRAKLLNVYGGETLEYDANSGRTYIYSNDAAVGVEVLSGELKGVNLLDFNDYDSTAPERDNARQLQRWETISVETFPSENIQSGADGGWAFLNFGDSPSLAPEESFDVWVSFTHGADLDVIDARLDSAKAAFASIPTSVEEVGFVQKPDLIQLDQNFPNPFNPSTTIQFNLPSTQAVNLEVFNVLGQKVATILDGIQPAGLNTVNFDASSLSTGMYIYRLSSNGVSVVRKMSLIK